MDVIKGITQTLQSYTEGETNFRVKMQTELGNLKNTLADVKKIADKLKGQLPIGLVVLKSGVDKDNDTISKECVQMVREKIGPVAAFKVVIVIKRLPKTRSGKILRGTIRKIADNVEYKIPPTIDDPAILTEIREDLIQHKILNNG